MSTTISDIEQITVEQVFNREKKAALERIAELENLVQKADLQSVQTKSVAPVSENLSQRILERLSIPTRMLDLASKLRNHLKNIETIVSLLREETDDDEDPDF